MGTGADFRALLESVRAQLGTVAAGLKELDAQRAELERRAEKLASDRQELVEMEARLVSLVPNGRSGRRAGRRAKRVIEDGDGRLTNGQRLLAALALDPSRVWSTQAAAEAAGIANLNSARVALSRLGDAGEVVQVNGSWRLAVGPVEEPAG